MTHTFYIFETFVPQVFKFGYTKQDLKSRMKAYTGVSKPKRHILTIETANGLLMESFFKCYLKSKNIKFDKRFGREYFVFDGNRIINTTNAFKNMFANTCTTKKNNTLLNINTLPNNTLPNCKLQKQTLEHLIQLLKSNELQPTKLKIIPNRVANKNQLSQITKN